MSTANNLSSEDKKPNVKELMREIREKIKNSTLELKDKREEFKPSEINSKSDIRAGDILHSDELSYLNRNYNYMPRLELEKVQSHRFGIFGKLLVKLKRKVLVVVWEFILKDYFESERQFQAKLVKHLNDQTKYIDARDADNFWQLIRKIDVDASNLSTRYDSLQDEYLASLATLEKRFNDEIVFNTNSKLGEVNSKYASLEQQVKTVENVARGLEAIVSKNNTVKNSEDLNLNPTSVNDIKEEKIAVDDYSYLLLENRYRGSEEAIKKAQEFYVELLKDSKNTVLEIGSGRGELQELLKENNIDSYGVDIDQAMIEHSKDKGLNVILDNGLRHLKNLEDNSLGAIIALQVVEHLNVPQIEELCILAKEKLVSGGKLVLETINPISLLALSAHYFRDPTHVQPLHPETLEYIATLKGLTKDKIHYLSKLSDDNQLLKINTEDSMPIRWNELVDRYNHNVERLNNVIFGYMDYCLVVKKS